MNTHCASRRGVAAEVVVLTVVLVGGAGWFGVKEIKQAVQQHQQNQAAKELEIRQAAADAAAAAAAAEREKAALARVASDEAIRTERARQVQTGRSIQRASVQGALIATNLPESLERTLLSQRFMEIDVASAQLFQLPEEAELAAWRKLAADALAGQAEAQVRLAGQIDEVRRLATALKVAQEARVIAEQNAAAADQRAASAQEKFNTAYSRQKVAVRDLIEAATRGDSMALLAKGLGWIVAAVAGIWALGMALKIFSIGLPAGGAAARYLGIAANTFNSLLAPTAVLGEAQANKQTEKLVQSTGSFITDVRDKLDKPTQEKITELLDIALSPNFQKKVCEVHTQLLEQRAVRAVRC